LLRTLSQQVGFQKISSGMPPLPDLQLLLKSMDPVLNPGVFVFATVASPASFDLGSAVALVREPEGLSVVMEEAQAGKAGLTPWLRCAWITLSVHSELEAVGLTAAVATALSNVDIPCNVVAGTRHDHIFVPVDLASTAMTTLRALQQQAHTASDQASSIRAE
jgi:hypothetical protein